MPKGSRRVVLAEQWSVKPGRGAITKHVSQLRARSTKPDPRTHLVQERLWVEKALCQPEPLFSKLCSVSIREFVHLARFTVGHPARSTPGVMIQSVKSALDSYTRRFLRSGSTHSGEYPPTMTSAHPSLQPSTTLFVQYDFQLSVVLSNRA